MEKSLQSLKEACERLQERQEILNQYRSILKVRFEHSGGNITV